MDRSTRSQPPKGYPRGRSTPQAARAEKADQNAAYLRSKKKSPSPLADQTTTSGSTSSKSSSFPMRYYPITTTLERNAHFRPQFDPKSTPFWPKSTPKHTRQLRRPVFYDRFSLSPPPLSNGTSTRPSKKTFRSRVVVSFVKNDTTLEPNARLSHFLGGGRGRGSDLRATKLQGVRHRTVFYDRT